MTFASFVRLIALAAIWGASFLFMRISAPVLGPVLLVEGRVGFAAVFLLMVGIVLHKPLAVRNNGRHYLALGFFNSALPFLLFSFAAKTLSASLLSILNATAPIWGAVIGALWTRTALSGKAVLGLILGVIGVAVLVGYDPSTLQRGAGLAILSGVGAAISYGVATTYARTAKQVAPFANAHGSMWAALLMISPAAPFFAVTTVPSLTVMAAVVALGVVCSGIAYLLYFRLIADIGAAPALTVAFLIPVFGVLWGHVFLDEPVGWNTFVGAGIVLAGTALVTGFSLRTIFPGKLSV